MVSTMLTRHVPVTPQASLCSNILPPVHWHRHRPPSAALHSPRSQLQAPPICSIHPTVAPHVLLEVHQELVFVEEGLDMEQGWELLRRAVMQPSISSMQGAAVMSAPARFESAGSHDDSNTPSARGRVQSGPSTSNRGSPASQKGSETGSNSKGHGTPTPAASAAQQVEEARGEQKDGSSGGPGGEDPRREYLINFGKAVRTLREDLPHVLDPRALRMDIYDEELLFQSQWLNLSGRSAYSRTLAMLQQTARLAFRDRHVEVQRLWSPSEGLLRARCRVVVTPCWSAFLWPWAAPGKPSSSASTASSRDSSTSHSTPVSDKAWVLDVLFTYRFSSSGLIVLHKVEDMDPPHNMARQQVRLPSLLQQPRGTGQLQPEVPAPAEGQAAQQSAEL